MEKTNIEKPLALKKEDLQNNLINLINNSGLPLFIVEYILKDLLQEIRTLNEQWVNSEKLRYQAALDELEKENSKKESGE